MSLTAWKNPVRYALVAALAVAAFAIITSGAQAPQQAAAGLDKGTFEVLQMSSQPTAWVWVEDDTIDGNGVEYWALHGSFVHPGPNDPSVTMTFDHANGVTHNNLNQFINWIVNNNSHVSSSSDIVIHKRDVSVVP